MLGLIPQLAQGDFQLAFANDQRCVHMKEDISFIGCSSDNELLIPDVIK